MKEFIVFFIGINILNVVIQTTKSLLTVNGNKWSASIINAITYFVYTYVIVFTATDGLSTFWKAVIVAGCNLVGVWIVKFVEEKCRKDKLWIFQATVKEDSDTVAKIHTLLKDMDIACVYNEVVKDKLYSLQVFSYTQRESDLIKSLFENYDIRYSAVETTDKTPKKKKEPKEKKNK